MQDEDRTPSYPNYNKRPEGRPQRGRGGYRPHRAFDAERPHHRSGAGEGEREGGGYRSRGGYHPHRSLDRERPRRHLDEAGEGERPRRTREGYRPHRSFDRERPPRAFDGDAPAERPRRPRENPAGRRPFPGNRPRRRPQPSWYPQEPVENNGLTGTGSGENEALSPEQYIFGRNPVSEALASGRAINKVWILERQPGEVRDHRLAELEKAFRERGLPLHWARRQTLDRLTGGAAHQGVVVQLAAQDYVQSSTVLERLQAEGQDGFILILDELQDGHNLGACLRVADAAAVDLIVIPERRSVSLDAYVAKASAGAIEYVPVARETNLTQFVMDLKKAGYWIFGTAMDGSTAYDKADFSGKIALIIGSEGKGMSDKLREHCDFLLSIPMYGRLNSLNASVACGIVCSMAARRRHPETAAPASAGATASGATMESDSELETD